MSSPVASRAVRSSSSSGAAPAAASGRKCAIVASARDADAAVLRVSRSFSLMTGSLLPRQPIRQDVKKASFLRPLRPWLLAYPSRPLRGENTLAGLACRRGETTTAGERFCDMDAAHRLLALQIGNRAGHAQDPVI